MYRILSIRIAITLMIIHFSGSLSAQFYDGSNLSFGKNRIQYSEFLWQYYRFERYDTYFYEGGKELATHVSRQAPSILKDLENRMDYVIQDRIEFIVYNTHTDFKQSNLGLIGTETQTEIGGTAKIVGHKVFLFFEGDYASLNKQIEAGISRLIINELIYGGDWKDVIKNSALMNFPDWYVEGLVSYLSEGWTPLIQDRVRDGILSGRYQQFNRLEQDEAIYCGHSIWKYVADVYGESVIPNILYMAKVNRSIESGFIFVLGLQLGALMEEHDIYFRGLVDQQNLAREESMLQEALVKTKKGHVYGNYRLSPDGKHAAFVSNILGQYRVWLYELDKYSRQDKEARKKYEREKAEFDKGEILKQRKSKDYAAKEYKTFKPKRHKPKKLYKAEHKLDRIVDKSYPILEWNPRGTELSFITESKGTVWLNTYNLSDGKTFKRELFGLQKVLSFDYSHDGKRLVMSAVNKGQSDIYIYYLLGNRQQRLTNDNYDDLHPRFFNKSSKVVFSSNRVDDTLRLKHMAIDLPTSTDIFTIDVNGDNDLLEQITSTPDINETYPFKFDSVRYTYLSDVGGLNNRYVATYDSVISRVDTTIHYRYFTKEERLTNDERSAIDYHINAKKKKFGVLKFIDGKYRFLYDDISSDISSYEERIELDDIVDNSIEEEVSSPTVVILYEEETEQDDIDTRDYQFDKEKKIEEEGPKVVIIEDYRKLEDKGSNSRDSIVLLMPKARNYKLNFTNDEILAQPGNSFNNVFYQNSVYGPQNLSPGFNPMFQVGISDLFEDRRLIGTVRVDPGFQNLGYGVRYDNFLKRLDKSVIFQRQSFNASFAALPNTLVKLNTLTLRYQMSYPFSEVLSIRLGLMGQYDRTVFLSLSDQTLDLPNVHNMDGGGKAELVFDNTLHKGLNLRTGTRAKAWAEYYHEYDIDTETYPNFGVIGIDFRNYQQLHREMILALRLAGNTTFGQRKLVSFLGGVDNWLVPPPRVDDLPVDYVGQNYVYQAMISPMRGFYRNARNGTHAVVANAEIRWPIFDYFMKNPIRSDFIRNFQIVPFADAGTAWTGDDPYSEDNFFNVINDPNSLNTNIQITLRNQEDPLLVGYGLGLRSRIAGYFVRADWAWGVVDGRRLPSEFYLSLNLDF